MLTLTQVVPILFLWVMIVFAASSISGVARFILAVATVGITIWLILFISKEIIPSMQNLAFIIR